MGPCTLVVLFLLQLLNMIHMYQACLFMCPLSQSFHIWSICSYTQVLIYSGQLDVIVAAPLTERFLPTVNWTGAAEYKTAPRFHWKVQPSDTEVAGYVRQVKEFYQVSMF